MLACTNCGDCPPKDGHSMCSRCLGSEGNMRGFQGVDDTGRRVASVIERWVHTTDNAAIIGVWLSGTDATVRDSVMCGVSPVAGAPGCNDCYDSDAPYTGYPGGNLRRSVICAAAINAEPRGAIHTTLRRRDLRRMLKPEDRADSQHQRYASWP